MADSLCFSVWSSSSGRLSDGSRSSRERSDPSRRDPLFVIDDGWFPGGSDWPVTWTDRGSPCWSCSSGRSSCSVKAPTKTRFLFGISARSKSEESPEWSPGVTEFRPLPGFSLDSNPARPAAAKPGIPRLCGPLSDTMGRNSRYGELAWARATRKVSGAKSGAAATG